MGGGALSFRPRARRALSFQTEADKHVACVVQKTTRTIKPSVTRHYAAASRRYLPRSHRSASASPTSRWTLLRPPKWVWRRSAAVCARYQPGYLESVAAGRERILRSRSLLHDRRLSNRRCPSLVHGRFRPACLAIADAGQERVSHLRSRSHGSGLLKHQRPSPSFRVARQTSTSRRRGLAAAAAMLREIQDGRPTQHVLMKGILSHERQMRW
jgi:hypothetical protein